MGMATDADMQESRSNVEALRRIVHTRRRELAELEALLVAWTGRPAGPNDPAELHRMILGGASLPVPAGASSHAQPAPPPADWVCWYKYELALVFLATNPPTPGRAIDRAVNAKNASWNARSKGYAVVNDDGCFELTPEGVIKLEQIKKRRVG